MRPVFFAALLLPAAFAAGVVSPPADDLYSGWLKMYDLKFDDSHQIFDAWKQTHPADPMGTVSNAAAYLFSEFARLGILESELFTDNQKFLSRGKVQPDPKVREAFEREIAATDRLTDAALHTNPADTNALLAKSMSFGLRADSASLLDRKDLTALHFMKESRTYEEKVLMVNPMLYDAYLSSGTENYLLSLKAAPLRFLLKITGSVVDRDKGVQEVTLTAQHGHYLEPFAKLLLAVAAMRDNNRTRARELLSELHQRFPDNPLYLREMNRLDSRSK